MKMKDYEIQIANYQNHLQNEEHSPATIRQYQRDVLCFLALLDTEELCRETVLRYKHALEQKYRPISVNAKLSALNSFFSFIGRDDLKVKFLKIQKRAYCSADKELSKGEYLRLVEAARDKKNEKLALLLQTICGTGIRVSEVRFITAEAVIQLKGKTRTILIPRRLQKCLKDYLRRKRICSGPVFTTKSGQPLDRSNIWKMMKALCCDAGVDEKKVFPHNLRHLFARCFYSADKDIAKLADILGHSSINTTRVYIITSGTEHRRQLDALGLVI